MLSTVSLRAQEFCASDRIHEQLMTTDSLYAANFRQMNREIRRHIDQKVLDLDNTNQVTIPLVVHVIHTGDAVGTIYNPSDADILSMIDGLNDYYANDNGLGVDINVDFALASRNESCSATTGINRVDGSVVTDYSSGGVDAGSGTGADEATVKALSKWNNVDYYNIWIVNKIDGNDGTSGTFTAGFAYYPIANAAVDGTVMLATQIDPDDITLPHEIGHALNLAHTFNGDGTGSTCPTDADCTTDGDYCCDTPAHQRNAFSCITSGTTCTGDAVGDVYKNIMSYSGCQDRFTDDQRDRMRAALEVSRPGLVSSQGDEAPPSSTATSACTPGLTNSGNYGIGPRTIDFGDNRTYTPTQGSSGLEEYLDLSCNQQYWVYPGEEIDFSVTTGSFGQRVRTYIDYNDNGTLDDSGELAFSSSTSSVPETHSGTITISGTAETETPLRMRVWADYYSGGGTDGPCGNLGYGQAIDFSLMVEDVDVWTGATSTDWSTASNWAKGTVPTSSGNVRIPSAPSNQPHVTASAASPAVCADLEVQSGATLTIDAGKALTASGDTDNEGTILIKADASGIGSFLDNGTISGSGSFQMEQYLTGSGGATPNGLFYYVGSPVVGATAATYSVASGNKLWSANESTQSYPQITNGSTALNMCQGYVSRMGASGSVTFSGTSFYTGNQSASGLTRTGTTETNRGYNLVSNPYPSTVNWDDLARTNLESTMWYRTHNGSTMLYDTYNATGGVGTNNNGDGAVEGTIPPTQAFWVRVDSDGNTGQLDFENTDRNHGTLTSIYKTEAAEGQIRMSLSNGDISDQAILVFNSSAQDGFDEYDSHKFWASASLPQLYMNLLEDTVVINGLYSTETNPTVPLGVKIPVVGEYYLNADELLLAEQSVLLEDQYLGVFQDLNVEASYPFSSEAGNFGDRFILHFSQITGLGSGENGIQMYCSDNRVYVSLENARQARVTVVDLSGRIIQTENLSNQRETFALNTAAGVYLVKVETESQSITKKISIR